MEGSDTHLVTFLKSSSIIKLGISNASKLGIYFNHASKFTLDPMFSSGLLVLFEIYMPAKNIKDF